jgi:hypothetical protein
MLSLYDGTPAKIDELMSLTGAPRWKVKKWATELGLARQKEPRWTQEDEEYLERNISRKSLADIAKHLERTKTAVKLKAKRLGLNKTIEGYTMRGLCMALGCDHHKVEKWLHAGWLQGKRRGTERTTQDYWYFTDRNIRKFIIEHPTEIDQRRVDWLWVVDLLGGTDYVGIGELSSPTQSRYEGEEICLQLETAN